MKISLHFSMLERLLDTKIMEEESKQPLRLSRVKLDTLLSMKIYIAGQRLNENKSFKEKTPLKAERS